MGASTVKWTTPNLCPSSSSSESNLYTNLKKNIDLQSQTIYDDKKNSKKGLHILEDYASGVQVGDIKQVTP